MFMNYYKRIIKRIGDSYQHLLRRLFFPFVKEKFDVQAFAEKMRTTAANHEFASKQVSTNIYESTPAQQSIFYTHFSDGTTLKCFMNIKFSFSRAPLPHPLFSLSVSPTSFLLFFLSLSPLFLISTRSQHLETNLSRMQRCTFQSFNNRASTFIMLRYIVLYV